MIFFKATIHKDQLSADFEWPGKINLTQAELDAFIRELMRIKRQLLPMPPTARQALVDVNVRNLQ